MHAGSTALNSKLYKKHSTNGPVDWLQICHQTGLYNRIAELIVMSIAKGIPQLESKSLEMPDWQASRGHEEQQQQQQLGMWPSFLHLVIHSADCTGCCCRGGCYCLLLISNGSSS